MQPVSAAFSAAIPRRHVRTSRVTSVSLNLATGVFTELAVLTGPAGVVLDGEVTIDRTRTPRRTATLAIASDAAGTYTPDKPGDPFYLFSMLRLQRGLVISGVPEYVDLGYFIVDQPASSFTARSGAHRIGLSDRFAMASEARFTAPLSFAADVRVRDVQRTLAQLAGLGTADALYSLDDGGATIGFVRAYEYGDLIPSAMARLAEDHGLELFMSAPSVLVMRPIPDPNTLPVSYTFAGGSDAIVTEISKELSARSWYNVASAIGEGPDMAASVVGTAAVTDPASPSHPDRIGVRVKPPRVSAQIRTQAQATAVALADLYEVGLEEARVTGRHVAHPALEAGDAIRIVNDRARLDDKLVLDVVRHPLRNGQSSFETRRVRVLT